MKGLSVIIITFNEERNIKACLESVSWADELIVVDSGSTDRTVQICKEYTDHVFDHPFEGFGKQKNLALEKAHCDWILSVDADERVDPALRDEIRELLKEDVPRDAFKLSRKSYFGNKLILRCGWYPDYSIRLFRRGKGKFNELRVHESVQINGKTGVLKGSLIHFTYRDIADFLAKMNRYTTLAASDQQASGAKGSLTDMILRPPATFVKMYILKRGFLEGTAGLVLCTLYSIYTFLKYAKLWELNQREKL